MGRNIEGKKVLITSTVAGEAWHYDYIGETGIIINQKVVDEEEGMVMFDIAFDAKPYESFFREDFVLI